MERTFPIVKIPEGYNNKIHWIATKNYSATQKYDLISVDNLKVIYHPLNVLNQNEESVKQNTTRTKIIKVSNKNIPRRQVMSNKMTKIDSGLTYPVYTAVKREGVNQPLCQVG